MKFLKKSHFTKLIGDFLGQKKRKISLGAENGELKNRRFSSTSYEKVDCN